MAQKKQGQEAAEHGVQGMKWDQRYKELEDAIIRAKTDASNIDLLYYDVKLVDQHLKQASEHLALAKSEPDKREEHIQAGFDYVGGVRGILGNNSVQSKSFRRHQWPFLPPGMD
jgi:hypothetical protein